METPNTVDPTIAKLIASVTGALVSINFVKGTWPERILMVIGGSALSYYGTTPIASGVNLTDAEGLVGFLLGLFGMAIVSRLYEAIQALDFKVVLSDLWQRALKRLGL